MGLPTYDVSICESGGHALPSESMHRIGKWVVMTFAISGIPVFTPLFLNVVFTNFYSEGYWIEKLFLALVMCISLRDDTSSFRSKHPSTFKLIDVFFYAFAAFPFFIMVIYLIKYLYIAFDPPYSLNVTFFTTVTWLIVSMTFVFGVLIQWIIGKIEREDKLALEV